MNLQSARQASCCPSTTTHCPPSREASRNFLTSKQAQRPQGELGFNYWAVSSEYHISLHHTEGNEGKKVMSVCEARYVRREAESLLFPDVWLCCDKGPIIWSVFASLTCTISIGLWKLSDTKSRINQAFWEFLKFISFPLLGLCNILSFPQTIRKLSGNKWKPFYIHS